jgi:tRNA G10  N-methylase Trm11
MVQRITQMEYLFFQGSNAALSAVEIYSYFLRVGIIATYDTSLLPKILVVKTQESLDCEHTISRLGGTPIISRVIAKIEKLEKDEIIDKTKILSLFKQGEKPILGISYKNLSQDVPVMATARDLRELAMKIKKTLALKGLRMVLPQSDTSLSSAQIFNSQIPDKAVGIELIQVSKNNFILAQIEAVQDIDFFTRRDRERPAIDPGKGMIPVKVAQIFLNLSQASPDTEIYDPFCGAGTIASEALLMDFNVVASDISLKQVERTKENVDWLKSTFSGFISSKRQMKFFGHDITKPLPENITTASLSAVVSEGWLGPAINRQPSAFEIENTFVRTQELLLAVLNNTYTVLKSGARIVIALPAFRVDKRVIRAPFLHEDFRRFLPKGYEIDPIVPGEWSNPVFRESSQGMMLYGRPDALVLRDILRLKKI